MDRLQKICQDNDITLEQLADMAKIEVPMFEAYATGELLLDKITLHHILDYSGDDWMWLEFGWNPADLGMMDISERAGWSC